MLNSSHKATFTLMDELKYFSESAEQVTAAGEVPGIPVAVITRGKRLLPDYNGRSLEDEWRDMQRELLDLSPAAWQIIARNSGHNIHKDAPETVVAKVVDVIRKTRSNRGETRYLSQHRPGIH